MNSGGIVEATTGLSNIVVGWRMVDAAVRVINGDEIPSPVAFTADDDSAAAWLQTRIYTQETAPDRPRSGSLPTTTRTSSRSSGTSDERVLDRSLARRQRPVGTCPASGSRESLRLALRPAPHAPRSSDSSHRARRST